MNDLDKEILEILKSMQNDIKAINAKLDEHKQILSEHTKILNEHTKILNEHTRILNDHTQILNEHSERLNEHSQILSALEHSSEVHKAQMDKMELSAARLEGNVKGIKEDISTIECVTSKNWNDIAKLKAVK